MATQPTSARRNGHHIHRDVAVTEARCPYCGQAISKSEFEGIKARIEAEEKARIAKVEQALNCRFASEQKQAQAKAKAEVQKATRAAEAQVRALRARQEETIRQRVAAQREALVKEAAEAIAGERTKMYAEKQLLQNELEALKRRVEQRPPHELAESSESELYEILISTFPEDQITRVAKGERGPDILIKVCHKDLIVGQIVIDCKNVKRWAHNFTRKLRQDQLAEGADFAILSSSVLPKGKAQLCLQDHVVIATPGRVPVLVALFRREIIRNHALRLSADARAQKSERLYLLMTSEKVDDLWERLGRSTDGLLDIEKSDAAWQAKTRDRRTEMIHNCQAIQGELLSAIDEIIAAAETADEDAS
jgi:hypothetical protein